jgi:hypothetical protein
MRFLVFICFFFLITFSGFSQTVTTAARSEPAPYLPPLPKEELPRIIQPQEGSPTPPDKSSSSPSNPNTSPTASPEAMQAKYLQDIPVNLYTGTPLVKVPICSISEGGIDVGIALNYNASGVRANALSGWTGLGWDLEGVPTLSRIVRGLPDEGKLDINTWNTFHTRHGFYFYPWIGGTTDTDHDKEPDIFLLNLGGNAYRFMFDANQKAKFFPDADIKVEVVWANNPYQFNHYVKVFKQFKFTLPDGSQYLFTDENKEETAEVEVHYAQNNAIYPIAYYNHPAHFQHYLKANSITSSWYVKKISSPFFHEINFSYNKVQYTYYKLAENEANGSCPSSVNKEVNRVFVQGCAISKIEGTDKVISFNDGKYVCSDYTDPETGKTTQSCYLTGANRQDIDSWMQNPQNTSNSKLLENIVFYDKNTPNDKQLWTFDYGYFAGTNNGGYDLPSGYSYSEVGTTHQRRLRLARISIPDGNKYDFTYFGEGTGFNYKTRFTYGIDHWGFINGYDGNIQLTGLIGKDYLTSCSSNSVSNRETSTGGFSVYGSLLKITLTNPSNTLQSETSFNYESNQVKNYSFVSSGGVNYNLVGGLRIKELTTKDLVRNINIVKKYDYTLSNGNPSGFLFVKPIYRFDGNDGNKRANSALYESLLGESSRPIVGYSRVVESTYDVSNNFLSRSISYFDQDETELKIETQSYYCYWTHDDTNDDGNPDTWVYHCDPYTAYLPQFFTYQYDFRSGNLIKLENYNQNNTLVSVNEMNYTPSNGILNGQVYSRRVVKLNGQTYSRNYYFDFKKYRLEQQVSKVYSLDGSGNMTSTTTDFTYKDEMPSAYRNTYQGTHNQVVKTSSIDSYGYTHESFSKYSADFTFDVDSVYIPQTCYDQEDPNYSWDCSYWQVTTHVPASGSEPRGIYELQQKGMSHAVVETFTKRNGKVVSSAYQSYYPDNSPYKALTQASYAHRNVPATSFTEMTYNKDTELLNKDAAYGNERIKFLEYNSKGGLQKAQVRKGASSQMVYSASQLLTTAKVSNVGISDALTTTYQYGQKFNQMSKVINPNATEIRHEYDAIGRLSFTKDKNNAIINHYLYQQAPASGGGTSNISWNSSAHTCSNPTGNTSIFTVYVNGLASGATAQFSIDGSNYYSANVGNSGYQVSVPYVANSSQAFWARASDNTSQVISGALGKCSYTGGSTNPPTISITNNGLCTNTITATNCSGTVNWSNGQSGNSINVATYNSTTYTATCTANGSTSGNSNSLSIPVLPSGWTAVQIGSPPQNGCVSESNGTWTIQATGNTYDFSDNLNYVYKSVSGNAIIIAKINSISANQGGTPPAGSRSGIMLRASTSPTAHYYQFFFDAGYNVISLYNQDNSTGDGQIGYTPTSIPIWLRLKKNGNDISAWYSSSANPNWNNDGDWTLYTTVNSSSFSSGFLMGIEAYNNAFSSNGLTNTSQFSGVSINNF